MKKGVSCVVLLGSVIILLVSLCVGTPASYNYNQCKLNLQTRWMGSLASTIGTKNMFQIVVPGTHDAGSYSLISDKPSADRATEYNSLQSSYGSYGSILGDSLVEWSKTQTLTFADQLSIGVRYFDLRLTWDVTISPSSYRFYHFLLTSYTAPDALRQQFQTFVANNPTEIIILDFNHLLGFNSTVLHTNFWDQINSIFGASLLPSASMLNMTYNQLIQNKYQVIALYEGANNLARNGVTVPGYIIDNGFVLGDYSNANRVPAVLNFEYNSVGTNAPTSAAKGVYYYPQFIITAFSGDISDGIKSSLTNPLSDPQTLQTFTRQLNSQFDGFYNNISSADIRVVYVDYVQDTNALGQAKVATIRRSGNPLIVGRMPGQICSQDTDCYFGNCQTNLGFCLIDCPLANGSGCGSAKQCLSGVCKNWTCSTARVESWFTMLSFVINYFFN
eukprot:TRINITY_DN2320_c1_g2_i1.p1 TRINITY_DN2320_c1_g2~~TRINITY_DN2320_c1_g2_i1.p1  ORF type:complete len:446 (-),score=74.95 TRINITY_DN2320_c1_g2_i1:32-1369(-)